MATITVPLDVNAVDLAFGGDMRKLIPPMTDIPKEFTHFRGTKWNKIVADWFFFGLKNLKFKAKDGIDGDKALRHISAIMRSWEPRHEHKEAACAYLLSQWFDEFTYERGQREKP